jgi:hypothetical protein
MEAARQNNTSRLTALRNYRKAKGLCFKCGEKWGPEHTCPQTVQMHVVEELLELFSQEELIGSEVPDSSSEEMETTCSISIHALTGAAADNSGVIQLHAFIGKHEVLILVDSGSSTSFINQQLAELLPGSQPLPRPCRVNVADGTQHKCNSFLPGCQWSSQGHQFATDLKILPLRAFDVILGMDWLEQHNPKIDWIHKTLSIETSTSHIQLQGRRNSQPQCSAISDAELASVCRQGAVAHLVHVYALDTTLHVKEVTPTEVQHCYLNFKMCSRNLHLCHPGWTVTIRSHSWREPNL